MENPRPALFVGLDVHRKTVVATVLDTKGRRLNQTTLGCSDTELIRYLESLPGTKKVALEACSMWEHYYDAAASTGATITLSNPYKTRLIAEASLKSDKVDSEALARLLRIDSLPAAFAPPPELRALRALVTERVFYSRKASSVMNHIYYLLYRRGIEYEDRILTRKRKRETLRKLGIAEVDRGLDTLSAIESTRKSLDNAIQAAWAESPEAQLLSTIPGIGRWTAVALVAFLCPIDRFASQEHVSSYVGLVPSHHQSAEHQYHGPLKRDSNALVRWALVEASWIHRRKHPRGAVAKIARRVGRRRGASRGTVAGAHKLLKIIFAMLKRNEPFRCDAPESSTAVRPLRHRKMIAR
jgi:transposase